MIPPIWPIVKPLQLGPAAARAYSDIGQNARLKIIAENNHGIIATSGHAIDYPLQLTQAIILQFTATGINNAINAAPVLAFVHGGEHQCCVFEGLLQPRLLDEHHYYAAHGSGKLSADPFLRFITDVFCPNGRPTVREGIFLAAWTVQHVIDVNPGGVAGPVRIATLERDGAGVLTARSLPTAEIDEYLQAIESAASALRKWRDEIQSGHAADDAPEPPTPPEPPQPPEPPKLRILQERIRQGKERSASSLIYHNGVFLNGNSARGSHSLPFMIPAVHRVK
jgi:hypothetical protein